MDIGLGKLAVVGLVLNEVRGLFVVATGAADLNAKGWQVGTEHYLAAALLIVPILAWELWKRIAKVRAGWRRSPAPASTWTKPSAVKHLGG